MRELGRLLSFRAGPDDFARFGSSHLALGLLLTWLVGMGRWWDDPRAGLGPRTAIVAVLLPVALIVLCLWMLGFARGIFTVMGGIRDASADALANEVVFGIGLLSALSLLPLLIAYGLAIAAARSED